MVSFFNSLGLRFGSGEQDEVHEAVIDGFQANFRNEESADGTWERLKPVTQMDRALSGYPAAHPILYRAGDYYNSLVDPDNSEHFAQAYRSSNLFALEVGSESPLLAIHEGGTHKMPARSVTKLTKQSERSVGDAIEMMLTRLMQREGL